MILKVSIYTLNLRETLILITLLVSFLTGCFSTSSVHNTAGSDIDYNRMLDSMNHFLQFPRQLLSCESIQEAYLSNEIP